MFNYNLMIEDATDIEIMNLESKFKSEMGMHEISYMESGNRGLYTESVISTITDFVKSIFNKVREAVGNALLKLNAKIADLRLKKDYNKIVKSDIDAKRLKGELIAVPDEQKIKKQYDDLYKFLMDYYRKINTITITEDNITEVQDMINENAEKIVSMIEDINPATLCTELKIATLINDRTGLIDSLAEKIAQTNSFYVDKFEKDTTKALKTASEKINNGVQMTAIKSASVKVAQALKKIPLSTIAIVAGYAVTVSAILHS